MKMNGNICVESYYKEKVHKALRLTHLRSQDYIEYKIKSSSDTSITDWHNFQV